MSRRDDRDDAWRDAVEVTKVGDPADVVALLDSPDANVRLYAVGHIRRHGTAEAVGSLTQRLPEEDDELRAAIAGALADLRQEQSRETFVGLLNDPSPTVRRLALRGLAGIGDARCVDAATSTYASGDRLAKYEALDALASVNDDRANDALRSIAAEERSWRWRRRARKALRQRATIAVT